MANTSTRKENQFNFRPVNQSVLYKIIYVLDQVREIKILAKQQRKTWKGTLEAEQINSILTYLAVSQ